MTINFQQLVDDSIVLSKLIPKKRYNFIYGIPAGGILTGYIIAKELGVPLLTANEFSDTGTHIMGNVLLVDDLIDSGRTINEIKKSNNFILDTAVIYSKPHSPKVTYLVKKIPAGWVNLPHEKPGTGAEEHIVRLLEHISEDPTRKGLIDTPTRVIEMYKELFKGYDEKQKPKITLFKNGSDGLTYDEMIIDTGTFYSNCEHHMLPFFGKYWFAYIPHAEGNILGLSKIARVVDYHAAKLQIQERLTKNIVDTLWEALIVTNDKKNYIEKISPLGMGLVLKAEHLCKTMRGCKKKGEMTTSVMKGAFRDKSDTRAEFLSFINS